MVLGGTGVVLGWGWWYWVVLGGTGCYWGEVVLGVTGVGWGGTGLGLDLETGVAALLPFDLQIMSCKHVFNLYFSQASRSLL